LNADKAGVKISDRGMVEVNDHLQTSVPNIYAIAMLFVEQC
jgi:dihydrolipoamide dehydrogenase